MNRYQAATPRPAMMIAAVAMSALTLGLSILPAIVGSADPESRVGAVSGANAPMAAGVNVGTPIVVYGIREQNTAFEPVRHNPPARKEAG